MNKLIDYWNHYSVLILFVMLSFAGIFTFFIFGEESSVWQLWQVVDTSFAIALGVLAFFGYKEFMLSQDEIKIYFKVEGKTIDTGLSLLRKDFSRSEVLGILGMIQCHPKERFDLHASREQWFLEDIQTIQKGKKKVFVLPMSMAEFEQFEVFD